MRNQRFGDRISERGNFGSALALLAAALLLQPSALLRAQSTAPSPPKNTGVQITFLPPPMEGTLSLGVYDKKGRLVRVIAREATEKDFIVGLNGLITFWDGKDDAGKVMPPGTYSVRGYSVGAVEVEGVAYHGNDWMTDDESPHLRKITNLDKLIVNHGELHFDAETVNGAAVHVTCNALTGQILKTASNGASQQPPTIDYGAAKAGDDPSETEQQIGGTAFFGEDKSMRAFGFGLRKGKLFRRTDAGWEELNAPSLESATTITLGESGEADTKDVWVIDQTAQGPQVKEFEIKGDSTTADLKRRLTIEAGEPIPTKISAGPGETLGLLEENPGVQRIRTLQLEETTATPSASDKISKWKVMLSRIIANSDFFDAIKGSLIRPDGKLFIPEKEFVVRLIKNPLIKDEAATAHVDIGFNAAGSFLQTMDGLPLRRVTETPGLKWAVIGREGSGKLLTIFQSDGAVVEEFRTHGLASMMAFDAGDYDWTGK